MTTKQLQKDYMTYIFCAFVKLRFWRLLRFRNFCDLVSQAFF